MQQKSGEQRPCNRNQHPPPRRTRRRVEPAAEILSQDNEQHDRQPDYRADDQRQDQQDFVFVPVRASASLRKRPLFSHPSHFMLSRGPSSPRNDSCFNHVNMAAMIAIAHSGVPR